MPRSSIGQAKNTVRRALRAIIDREPAEKDITRLWDYFESACAYCGLKLVRSDRKGHADHLVHNGPNHISNRVLSCWTCNGDEKRDRDWIEFLKQKVSDAGILSARRERIERWVSENKSKAPLADKRGIVEKEIAAVVEAIDKAAQRLRSERAP